MSWKGILGKAGVTLTGPNGANNWTFEGMVHARNIISRFAGQHFHVDSGSAAASDSAKYGLRKEKPFATIDYAVGQCTANDSDVIWAHAGHTEAIIAASGLDLDVEGITIVFLGNGDEQAKITFGTDAGADMDVDADNITLINPRFETAVDALTGPIDINKANFSIYNGEYYDAAGLAATDCVVATATATGLTIDGWKYFESTTGTQKQSNLQLNGVDNLTLKNIDIRGDFGTGNIENVTDELLNARLEDIYLDNISSSPTPAIVLDSNCDGFARNVSCRIASGNTYISDASDINWGPNCLGYNADGGAGEPLGTAIATGLEGKIDIIDEFHDVPAQNNVLNAQINEVIGNKTDAAAAGAVTTTDTLVGYIKQLVSDAIAATAAIGTIDGLHDVPVADAATNLYVRDVVGIKTDAAAAGAVSSVESLMAYVKQSVTLAIARDTALGVVDGLHDVPIADAATNLYMRDVVGIKTDAAAAGAVSATESLMAYIKQLVGAAITEAAQTLKLDGVTISTTPTAASLASFIASGGTSLGTQLPASTSLYGVASGVQASVASTKLGLKVTAVAADILDGTTNTLFTVAGGKVLITALIMENSVGATDAASNVKFTMNPTVGTDADMNAATAVGGSENGSIWICPLNGSGSLSVGKGGGGLLKNVEGWVAPEGTIDVDSTVDTNVTNSAVQSVELYYIPLDAGATVVAI